MNDQPFQPDPDVIRWKMHFTSSPEDVYRAVATDEGRAAFWAESAIEQDGAITFEFMSGERLRSKILDRAEPARFQLTYFDDTTVTIDLAPDGAGGTDLTLTEQGVPEDNRAEQIAGWLNVLFPLKAHVDFGVDLRNHDGQRTWDMGYADQ